MNRCCISSSVSLVGMEYKFYQRMFITNRDPKTMEQWRSIPVMKIVARKIVKRVHINDDNSRELFFNDDTRHTIPEKEYIKLFFKHHKANRFKIKKRHWDTVDSFIENCI